MKKIVLSVMLFITIFTLAACSDGNKIVKIAVSTMPTKVEYYAGVDTALDLSGTIITLTTKANKTSTLAIDAQEDGKPVFTIAQNVDFATIGTYMITVSTAEGLSTTFEVSVVQPPYVDDNPIILSLYNDATRQKLTSYTGPFVKNVDIGVFSVFFTDTDKPGSGYFQNVFTKYYNQYTDITAYKIGYYISFKLKSGETMEKVILGPKDDPDFMWDYVRVYLYDDVHQPIGHWYRHLLESEVKDNTLMTSIKLTGNGKTTDIDGAITLTAFAYNGTEDFDPITGHYRGISSYTILISPK